MDVCRERFKNSQMHIKRYNPLSFQRLLKVLLMKPKRLTKKQLKDLDEHQDLLVEILRWVI